ncbi:MAG: DUF4037 domain-containing protein [Clostridiales bacterium]|nr:DUF4037 domain-containing protein [Clostridiales bacterium]
MKGLTLSFRYWQEIGLPAFQAQCPQILEQAAVGLVGEGSECFGYDDVLSWDHDWGPGFCVWLEPEAMFRWGDRARLIYDQLPKEFEGFRRLRPDPMSAGRVGVLGIAEFYGRFLGLNHPPKSLTEWRRVPESGLAVSTNGQVFQDPVGTFSAFRRELLSYYPEDVRRKKLAARCALAAQSGQYNYARCLRRGEKVAAFLALSQFVEHAQAIVFLLNRRFRPYYKWTQRALIQLPILGAEAAPLLEKMVSSDGVDQSRNIEELSALIIGELGNQGLSFVNDDFLLVHARAVQEKIGDPALRTLHLMAE